MKGAKPTLPIPPEVVDKFLSRDLLPTPTGCLLWRHTKNPDGYGMIRYRGRYYSTHRAAYVAHYGSIPDGLFVLHKCNNPPCCNPECLFVGTHQDNMRHSADQGRKRKPHLMGSKYPGALWTDADVRRLRAEYSAGRISTRDIASQYHTDKGTVSAMLRGITYSDVPEAIATHFHKITLDNQIRTLLATGMTAREIAATLDIHTTTVHRHKRKASKQ